MKTPRWQRQAHFMNKVQLTANPVIDQRKLPAPQDLHYGGNVVIKSQQNIHVMPIKRARFFIDKDEQSCAGKKP